ncbi:ABC transporter ATP-binding protein [Amylolactobacillus amylophilus]|uniref:ABC transporter ATP-binding protein n=1 Tax=Amylolactobacillus amylophilus TaxID=1603 RepID=UPI0006D22C86|nr:ABC transporter ATP-binding protein [Amylolactobacillus amylophilus]
MVAIKVENVTKSFGQLDVLQGVSLTVGRGEVFTLLGENGAGKTTLINILTTLSRQNSGRVRILGLDPQKKGNAIRRQISLNAQEATVDGEFTGYQNLRLVAKLRGVKDVSTEIERVARQLNLTDFLKRKVLTYSGGMRRRLDLAMSLIGDPQIIFLDEPTTGVDPKNRLALWQIITEMRDDGKTVFLTTQMLEEADRLSDHIAFINNGQIVRYGTPQEMKQLAQEKFVLSVQTEQLAETKKSTAKCKNHIYGHN